MGIAMALAAVGAGAAAPVSSFIDVQAASAYAHVKPLGTRGPKAGDYAVICGPSSAPWAGWTPLDPITFGKVLVSDDLTRSNSPNNQYILAIYRGATSAHVVSANGFAKADNHAGTAAFLNGVNRNGNVATLDSPSQAIRRLRYSGGSTACYLFDLTAPNPPYVDGQVFSPETSNFSIVELLA